MIQAGRAASLSHPMGIDPGDVVHKPRPEVIIAICIVAMVVLSHAHGSGFRPAVKQFDEVPDPAAPLPRRRLLVVLDQDQDVPACQAGQRVVRTDLTGTRSRHCV